MWRFYSDAGSYWVESYSVVCRGWPKTSFLQLVGNTRRVWVEVLLRTPFSLPKKSTYTRVHTVWKALKWLMYVYVLVSSCQRRWKGWCTYTWRLLFFIISVFYNCIKGFLTSYPVDCMLLKITIRNVNFYLIENDFILTHINCSFSITI